MALPLLASVFSRRRRRSAGERSRFGDQRGFGGIMSLRLRAGAMRFSLLACVMTIIIWWLISSSRRSGDVGAPRSPAAMPAAQARATAFRRLQSLPDTRSAECKALADEVSVPDGGNSEDFHVSAIVFARLGRDSIVTQTVASLIAHTPPAHLREIIVVTATGASTESVDALHYNLGAYGEIVKLATSDKLSADNALRSLVLVAHLASAPLVAMLDDSVIVHRGWLYPLAAELARHPNVIAAPVFDDFDAATLDFRKTERVHAWHFDWDLSLAAVTVHSSSLGIATAEGENEKRTDDEAADQQQQRPALLDQDSIATPALTGHLFVARRAFVDSVLLARRPDAAFAGPLDLSILCWLCGSGLRIVPCSRAARVGALRVVDPPPSKDAAALAARYFDRQYLELFSRVVGESAVTPVDARQQLNGCKSFKWYMQSVAGDVYVPEENVRAYGWFVSYSGAVCFWHESDGRLSGSLDCQGSRDDAVMVRLLADGALRTGIAGGEQCIGVDQKRYAVVTRCNESDAYQYWTLTGGMQLQLSRFRGHCLMHATDPGDVDSLRQVLMASPCARANSDDSKWQKWTSFKVLS